METRGKKKPHTAAIVAIIITVTIVGISIWLFTKKKKAGSTENDNRQPSVNEATPSSKPYCDAYWFGQNCEEYCDVDKHAIWDAGKCTCSDVTERRDGKCVCKKNRFGPNCDKFCYNSKNEQVQNGECVCIGNRERDSNGDCVCKANWYGQGCDQFCDVTTKNQRWLEHQRWYKPCRCKQHWYGTDCDVFCTGKYNPVDKSCDTSTGIYYDNDQNPFDR